MIYSIETVEGDKIAGNLEPHCQDCYKSCNSVGNLIPICKIDNKPKRLGIFSSKKGKGFLCCGETKTTKLFREKLENIVYAIPEFRTIKNDITKEIASTEQQRFKRVVHNLKSINAHNIQELYSLVPQEILTSDIEHQLDTIKNELQNNLEQSALTFLRMAKHNSHMKAEFSIYDKLFKDNPALNFRLHPIRKVILNVLHTFFIDFTDKGVNVSVNEHFGKLMLDYESIHVALYHIIENASKYIKSKSKLIIKFIEDNNSLKVDFEMDSLHIEPSETEMVFDEGYSGKNAIKAKKEGEGIGMYRIKRLVELNNAQFYINAGKDIFVFQGLDYSRNHFIIEFNKNTGPNKGS